MIGYRNLTVHSITYPFTFHCNGQVTCCRVLPPSDSFQQTSKGLVGLTGRRSKGAVVIVPETLNGRSNANSVSWMGKGWSGGGITEETVWEKSALKAEAPDRPPIPPGATKLSHINFGPRDFAA
jgi:hypothetical protein